MEYLEDPIPLHDITLTVGLDHSINRAYLAPTGEALTLSGSVGAWHVTIPTITYGAIVVLELA
jgi:hypothetical protein